MKPWLSTTLLLLLPSFVAADLSCEGKLTDYEVAFCESMDVRDSIRVFNAQVARFLLSNADKDNICPSAEQYVPLLVSYQHDFLSAEYRLCEIQYVEWGFMATHFGAIAKSICYANATKRLRDKIDGLSFAVLSCEIPPFSDLVDVGRQEVDVVLGFSCEGELNRAERAICNNFTLSLYDTYMSLLYRVSLRQAVDGASLRQLQRSFMRARITSCGEMASTQAYNDCLKFLYAERIDYLEGLIAAGTETDH